MFTVSPAKELQLDGNFCVRYAEGLSGPHEVQNCSESSHNNFPMTAVIRVILNSETPASLLSHS